MSSWKRPLILNHNPIKGKFSNGKKRKKRIPWDKLELLQNGHVDSINAALYLGYATDTLHHMRTTLKGPMYFTYTTEKTSQKRIYYTKKDLDKYLEEIS
jgi:hypothetical protein